MEETTKEVVKLYMPFFPNTVRYLSNGGFCSSGGLVFRAPRWLEDATEELVKLRSPRFRATVRHLGNNSFCSGGLILLLLRQLLSLLRLPPLLQEQCGLAEIPTGCGGVRLASGLSQPLVKASGRLVIVCVMSSYLCLTKDVQICNKFDTGDYVIFASEALKGATAIPTAQQDKAVCHEATQVRATSEASQ